MKLRLFFVSFVILFLELTLIRWISSNVRLAGYFTNLVLLGSFFGMGTGFLLAHVKRNLISWFPFTLALLIGFILVFRVEVDIRSPSILFFKPMSQIPNIPLVEPEYILPIIYLLVALVFASLSQEMGKLFKQFRPLISYTLDIAGALVGIILFTITSAFNAPSFVWFLIISIISFCLIYKYKRLLIINTVVLTAIMCIIFIRFYIATPNVTWSPYYKVTVQKDTTGWGVNVNNLGHQYITRWQNKESFYLAPYKLIPRQTYKKVLIIGAGTGADVAIALANNPDLERIDAVEIDPVIANLGVKLHPDKPFQDPRVRLTIADGRNFLENSKDSYDLIIFALTDSLVLTSHTANIRLESFLFTKESFDMARRHLSPDGLFVLYNFYREPWLVDKLALMLQDVFGQSPLVESYGQEGKAAAILVGPKINDLSTALHKWQNRSGQIVRATDDWPFLYVKEKNIPPFYIRIIMYLAIVSVAILIPIMKIGKSRFDGRFFFFGAGFMLLETKHLVTFSQLFGTTWLVNSLVFSAILASILVANIISFKIVVKSLIPLYILMFVVLLANYVVPPSFFMKIPLLLRFALASIFYFSPILIANIIFSQLFRDKSEAEFSFGSNLLGALFGGLLEYTALDLGYRALIPIIIGCYFLTLVKIPRLGSYGTHH